MTEKQITIYSLRYYIGFYLRQAERERWYSEFLYGQTINHVDKLCKRLADITKFHDREPYCIEA